MKIRLKPIDVTILLSSAMSVLTLLRGEPTWAIGFAIMAALCIHASES